MLLGQQRAGAAEPGLDLVQDQQHIVFGAERAGARQVAWRRDDHAGLALDRLDQEGRGVGGDGGRQRVRVAVGDDPEAGGERPEFVARGLVGAEADHREGAAVEVAVADDDLGLARRHALHLVGPFAGHLQRALDRLGARVHRQHAARAGQRAQLLVERAELVVVEGARGQRQPRRLLGQRRQDARVAVALVHRGIGRQAVKVAPAVQVPDPDALAARQHDVERLVVAGAVARLLGEEILVQGHGGSSSKKARGAAPGPRQRRSLWTPFHEVNRLRL